MLQLQRIIDCNKWIEDNSDKYEHMQSITVLIEDVGKLVRAMAFVNNQMAIAKKELNRAKELAYDKILKEKNGFTSPSLIKDYANARCSEEQYNYDLCERCSRTIVHTIDALRTCISALKTEMAYSNYQ